ncbi:MAG: hypothetical protein EA384_05515 [Spirochaetaceae bacterium]|nr:MAG: hypothetical protein EA384_05515 [Spirochaetaceae bacterium]
MGTSGIQIFGRKKCRDTQKAERFFRDRGISYQFVDLQIKPMSPGELKSVLRTIETDALIDSQSAEYRQRAMQWMEYDPLEELARQPALIRTPVVRRGSDATVGHDPDGWLRLATAP